MLIAHIELMVLELSAPFINIVMHSVCKLTPANSMFERTADSR